MATDDEVLQKALAFYRSEVKRQAREEVLDETVKFVGLSYCPIDGMVHVMDDPMGQTKNVVVRYKLGGLGRTVRLDVERGDSTKAVALIVEAVALDIAKEILKNPLGGLLAGRVL